MLVELDPHEPEHWKLHRVVQSLRDGGVCVLPTDTVYALAASIYHKDAIRRIYDLKRLDEKKPLSIIVSDFAQAARYTMGIPTSTFKIIKRCLPGPFTFIFDASKEIPKLMLRENRRTIGLRMPDCPIARALAAELDYPLLVTSYKDDEGEYVADPVAIEDALGRRVDCVVDGGMIFPEVSTIVDFTGLEPAVIREGKGDLSLLFG
jgi:tRNA threonylcarbamoyl adenosine modification protein (Sua5/YciO/YrdC/YwlC family)